MVADELFRHAVQFGGGHTRTDVPSHFGQSLTNKQRTLPHQPDLRIATRIPTGALENTALWQRLAATGVALFVYFVLTKKNLLAGVLSSAVVMYLLLLAAG